MISVCPRRMESCEGLFRFLFRPTSLRTRSKTGYAPPPPSSIFQPSASLNRLLKAIAPRVTPPVADSGSVEFRRARRS